MATRSARMLAAQAWCKPTTSKKAMDVDLAEAFAEVIDEIWAMSPSQKCYHIPQKKRNDYIRP